MKSCAKGGIRGKKNHYLKLRIKNTSAPWMLFELRMVILEKVGRHGAGSSVLFPTIWGAQRMAPISPVQAACPEVLESWDPPLQGVFPVVMSDLRLSRIFRSTKAV